MGAMFNSGRLRVASKRISTRQKVYVLTVKAMSEFATNLKVGGEEDRGMRGPVQTPMQYEKFKGFFTEGKISGWNFTGGGDQTGNGKRCFIYPTIIDNPPTDSRIVTEEAFVSTCLRPVYRIHAANPNRKLQGPVVPTQPWTDENEVISRANRAGFGVGACVWSKDPDHARRLGAPLEVGTVWIDSAPKPPPKAASGGHGHSGIGAGGGSQGLKAYCNVQAVHIHHR